jgi:hypothetical protein
MEDAVTLMKRYCDRRSQSWLSRAGTAAAGCGRRAKQILIAERYDAAASDVWGFLEGNLRACTAAKSLTKDRGRNLLQLSCKCDWIVTSQQRPPELKPEVTLSKIQD